MHRSYWLSGLGLAIGSALLIAVGFAGPAGSSPHASVTNGGVLRVVLQHPFDQIDPSRAYFPAAWALEFATACKLYNFGESSLAIHPEAATALPTVTNNGRTYTFTVKGGKRAMRFADGKPVTAANFAWALNRALRWKPASPAVAFLTDAAATDIVGADDVVDGRATQARGISVKGNKLIVTLVKPSPAFVTQLTMPFFQAMPLSWGTDELNMDDLPTVGDTCGPYHLTGGDQTSFTLIERNRFYRGKRPHHLAGVRWTMGVAVPSQRLLVERNQQDLGGFPPAAYGELRRKYAASGRFITKPVAITWYLSLNTQSKAFKGNPRLRQAVNFAINRRLLAGLMGAGAAQPTDQLLPPQGMPGFKDWKVYPFAPDLVKARQLAKGHLRGGRLVLYAPSLDPFPSQAAIVQANLKRLGIRVAVRLLDPGVEGDLVSRRDTPFDMAFDGWGSDYPDPYDFINILLSGKSIREKDNVNHSYFDEARWNKRMDQTAALPFGPRRYAAYARLDRDLVKGPAPIAAYAASRSSFFTSNRIKTFVYQPVYGQPNYAAIELK
jgi:peptide/nickel transport system substrate-binding protein